MKDICIEQDSFGFWDISLNDSGDIKSGDMMDSSLVYALLGERRASTSEVPIAAKRRGWIGNEGKDFENGSKLWLFEQARITRSLLTDIETVATSATNFYVEDGLAMKVEVSASLKNSFVSLEVKIFVSESEVETRAFELWKNTGNNKCL